ncbi:MAG TPA: branched-chain amino acid ABC transporter permease [Candidatus Acidoferrales bacterium]|nr:branched-chain amino acid ABC transporter permease [Candidatus Acidoferrales bacterium]
MSASAQAAGKMARVVRVLPPFLLLALLALLPLFHLAANRVKVLFLTFLLITASVAWNILGGFTGQVSFGFAVFYGLGAYTTALGINAGLSPYLTYPLAAAVAVVASLLVGLPTFRLRGPYFAIATIGVGEAVRVIMTNLAFTGGASGYRIVEHVPFRQAEHYYTGLVLATLAVGVSMLVRHSRFGLGLRAIRDDQEAAADSGVNPYALKLAAHALAAALTGASGGVYARYAAFISPDGVFAFQRSVAILLMPIIGGVNTIWGPVLGGGVYGVIEEELAARFPEFHLLLYGLLVILIILFEPGGLMGLLGRARRLFQRGSDA